jgi:aminoglycoside phosphotransferase (APT) family kinase protein
VPVPEQRDPELTRAALATWLRGRLPGAGDVAISSLRTPALSGFSSETLLFEAEWTRDGAACREALVARVAPTGYRLFPDPRFEDQCRLLRILDRDTDIPLPPVRWYEPDPGHLGGPFVVMDHVDGLVPPDNPPYHVDGWVREAAPDDRARMWWASVDLLARIHRLDVAALGLDLVDRPEYGRTGIDQQLGYYERFAESAGATSVPAVRRALGWLRREQPDEAGPPCLLWGDARIGNVIFHGFEPRAVLDWEMATLGQPEVDLAWFLYLDRHHSEGAGAGRLAGFPGAAETVARYERLLGRDMRHLAYHEVFAGLRFAVIMARLGQLFVEFGLLPPDSTFSSDNTAARLLGVILEDRC